jgi:hypothetical protein
MFLTKAQGRPAENNSRVAIFVFKFLKCLDSEEKTEGSGLNDVKLYENSFS